MINNIGWTSYWFALLIILSLYYSFVLFRYYKENVQNLHLKRKGYLYPEIFQPSTSNSFKSESSILQKLVIIEPFADCELLPIAKLLNDEIIAYMEPALYSKDGKNIFNFFSFSQLVNKFSTKRYSLRIFISNLLQFESQINVPFSKIKATVPP